MWVSLCHVVWVLCSHWLVCVTWSGYCALIGRFVSRGVGNVLSLVSLCHVPRGVGTVL